MRSIVRVIASVALFLVGTSLLAHAGQDLAKDGAARLLELSQKNTPPAVAAARAEYEQLKQAHPADARTDYVYGIALINQHRYEEAVSLLDRYLAHNAGDPHALRARIWARLQDRRYASAIKDAASLSRFFPRNQQPQLPSDLEQTAQFLGVVFGYLDFARRDVVSSELRLEGKNRILAALGDAYLPAFDKGRQTVAKRLADLEGRQNQKQQQAAEKTSQRQEQVEAALADDRITIASSQETIQASAEQLGDTRRQLGVLSTQLASLAKDRVRLTAQITYVQSLLLEIQTDLLKESTPSSSAATSVSIGTAVQYANLSYHLTGLSRQALRLDERIRALQMQAAHQNAKGRREFQTVAANQAAVQKAERRAKALEAQVRRLESEQPQRRVLTAEMKRFSTCLPFPFDEEKQRVLTWFED